MALSSSRVGDVTCSWFPPRHIAFTSARDEDWDLQWSADTYIVDIQDGRLVKASARVHTGPPWGDSHLTPAWSPDGSRIACIVTPDQHHPHWHGLVATMGTDGAEPRVLSSNLDRNARVAGPGRGIRWTPMEFSSSSTITGRACLSRSGQRGFAARTRGDGATSNTCVRLVLGTTALVSTDIASWNIVGTF
jgi:hypothetical protein